MKKCFFVVTGIFFLVVFSFTATMHAAEPVKPIELRFSTFLPLETPVIGVWISYCKELERRSDGRVKVTFYPAESLGKAKDHYNMAVTGIADITTHIMGYTPGRFPQAEVLELPILWPSAKVASRVCWDIYEKYLKNEFSDVHLIALATTDPTHIHTSKKPVRSMADMSGLRLRTGNPRMVEMIKSWGASPINVTGAEVYDALQKGMIDGVFINNTSLADFKLYEQLNHYTLLGMGAAVALAPMSLKAWNSLPPDIQKIVDEISGARQSASMGEVFDKRGKAGIDEAVKRGGKIYTLSDAEKANFVAKTEPIVSAWIANAEKRGFPGKKLYDDVSALVAKYSKE
ncbi:MAG: TRAP transporter substrate-binding protein [Thermodesulfobacteriota bacterium]